MKLHSLISRLRQERGMTQKELADQLGISPQYLNDIEHDRRTPTNDVLLHDIANHLKVSVFVVYYAVGKIPPQFINQNISPKRIVAAFKAMREALK